MLTIFLLESIFFPKITQTNTQTDKIQHRQDGVSQSTICHQHRCDSIMAASRLILMGSWLTALRAAVRKRCTSTWSSSATSILASLPPPVSLPTSLNLRLEQRAHIHNRSLDLQVRRYRQAYYREVREGKNISSSLPSPRIAGLIAILPLGGADFASHNQQNFCARTFFGTTTSVACCPTTPIIFYTASISLVQSLIRSAGSRRVGQGFFQVCVGS